MFSRNKIEFWTRARTTFIVRTLALMMLLGIAASFVRDAKSGTSVWKGDFPNFYSGAVCFSQYGPERLYDLELQRSIQLQNWPKLNKSITPFTYPPYVGVLLSPLGNLNMKTGLLVFVGVMFLAFLVASRIFQHLVAPPNTKYLDIACLLFLFAPISGGIFGSQNSALSLLLYVSILFLINKQKASAEFLAGAACGLWLFKPQYPVFFLLCALAGRRWHFLAGASIPAALYYLIAAYFFGWLWPFNWLEIISSVHGAEILGNAYQHVSLRGVATAIGYLFGVTSFTGLHLSGALVSVGLTAYVCHFAWKASKAGTTANSKFEDLLYLLGPLVLIISPHAHYYDLALCAPFMARLFKPKTDLNITLLAAVFMIALVVSSNRHLLAVNPLFLLPAALAFIGIQKLRKDIKSYNGIS